MLIASLSQVCLDIVNNKLVDPLDSSMSQYRNFFCSYRVPGIIKDDLISINPSNYIIVLLNNSIYKVPVLTHDFSSVISLSIIYHSLLYCNQLSISNNNHNNDSIYLTDLTLFDRKTAAEYRELIDNNKSIKEIEMSLFVVCLNEQSKPTNNGDYRDELNYNMSNRYYEKNQMIIMNKEVAINFELSGIDSGVAHNICSNLYINYLSLIPLINEINSENIEINNIGIIENKINSINEEIKIKWLLQKKLFKTEIRKYYGYDFTIEWFGRKLIKSKQMSPDGVIHIIIQLVMLSYKNNYEKLPYLLETVDSRKYSGGRLKIITIMNEEVKKLMQYIITLRSKIKEKGIIETIGEDEQIYNLLVNAIIEHKKNLSDKVKLHSYLHLHFLTNENNKCEEIGTNKIIEIDKYEELMRHDAVTSNLGYYKHINYVYSGHPVDSNMWVIGFIIEDNITKFTITNDCENENSNYDVNFVNIFKDWSFAIYKLLCRNKEM